jgi:hypothetical protein
MVDPVVACQLVDSFDFSDPAELKARSGSVKNASDTYQLDSSFSDGHRQIVQHRSHLNTAKWTCPIPPENQGIRIRKLYDRFHGRQRARMLIDGQLAGWWYEPEEDRSHRLAWATFGVEAGLTRGKSSLEISVDPPPASPLWDVSCYEVLALLPR